MNNQRLLRKRRYPFLNGENQKLDGLAVPKSAVKNSAVVILLCLVLLRTGLTVAGGSPPDGGSRWFLLKTTAYVRAPQPDEKIVYGVHQAIDLPEPQEVALKMGEKATWDTPTLRGELSGEWGWRIEVKAAQESIVRVSIGTALEKSTSIGPFILSYEFSRDEIYSEVLSTSVGQVVYVISKPVPHAHTFDSRETFFASEHEFIYLSIEVTGGGEIYVMVNNEDSYFSVE